MMGVRIVSLCFGAALMGWAVPALAESPRVVIVPTLGIQGEGQPAVVNQVLIQFERVAGLNGPVVQFSEMNLGGGSRVGEEWKDGVHHAVEAVARLVGEDGRDWRVTLKNRAVTAMTDGRSASGAIAAGLLAAYKGETLRSDVAVSAVVTPDGRIDVVGALSSKLEAAAGGHFRGLVVSRHQPYTRDWPQGEETANRLRIQLIQVGTLAEVYDALTGAGR